MTVHIGFKADLDLAGFLAQAELHAHLDREGQRPADVDAGHLREAESVAAAQVRGGPNGFSSDGLCGVNSSAPLSVITMSSSSRTPNSPGM